MNEKKNLPSRFKPLERLPIEITADRELRYCKSLMVWGVAL